MLLDDIDWIWKGLEVHLGEDEVRTAVDGVGGVPRTYSYETSSNSEEKSKESKENEQNQNQDQDVWELSTITMNDWV